VVTSLNTTKGRKGLYNHLLFREKGSPGTLSSLSAVRTTEGGKRFSFYFRLKWELFELFRQDMQRLQALEWPKSPVDYREGDNGRQLFYRRVRGRDRKEQSPREFRRIGESREEESARRDLFKSKN